VIADKHDDVMAKFGAILAQGIIDAGGRNVTVGLQTRTGHTNMPAVVGMLVFTQFWYWYPLAHFICLAFTPTAVIGLNSDLKMPQMTIKSNAKPSLYGYPAPLEEKKEKEREKVSTAVLSITAKAKRKEQEKKDSKSDEKMDVDSAHEKDSAVKASEKSDKSEKTVEKTTEKDAKETKDSKTAAKDSKESKDTKEKDNKEPKEAEPLFSMLENPARVVRQQLKVIQSADGTRYTPIKDLSIGGIIMLRDGSKSEPEVLVEPVAAGGPKVEDETEPEPPEPFDYIED